MKYVSRDTLAMDRQSHFLFLNKYDDMGLTFNAQDSVIGCMDVLSTLSFMVLLHEAHFQEGKYVLGNPTW